MSAFRTSANGLLRYVQGGGLADRIAEQLGHNVGASERRSWERSLPVLAQDLVDAGLGQVEMLVEYQLPLTSKRIDVVLAGTHPKTAEDSYVVVELKQWSRVESYEGSESLVLVEHAATPRLHPGVQVEDYCEYLADFLGVLAHSRNPIVGAAYLHNAVDRDVDDLFVRRATEQSRIFTKQRRGRFLDYLRSHLAPGSGAAAADRFLTSSVRPSKHLLSYAAAELKDRSHFTLLDEQRLAYELVLHAVERARNADRKSVVVVAGGPGSGKSVIALSVLGELARQQRSVMHATGSRSFTQTLRRYAGKGSTRMKNLFGYFNSFMTAERNGLDVLICDEAHRIRETSVNRFTPKAKRDRARPQIDELLAAARVPVFLLDEHQVVKPGELGNVEVISTYAKQLNLDVEVVSLHDQFRCGGSEAYEEWVVDLLGLDGGKPSVWAGDGRFDLRLADSPEEMEAFLAAKQATGETARMSAGYCWPWSDPLPDDSLIADVRIGGWARPWNVKSDRSVGDAPGSAFWATDPHGFGQVGCVYTAQGFEYEWSGVILGPDLVARDGRLVTQRAESKDPAFRSRKTLSDAEADRLIRNTYKVLMTRGMRGTILYSTDAETRAWLGSLIRVRRGLETVYEPSGG
ncbi:DNA/RNA helicase domain-containing protein [Micromonospora chalcea]|uniref:DNA/RNA helicase domain-containing protein n=1 Tax=Micromonospora chalcea TaxID=1874 RepID=UPI003830ED19